MIACDVLPVVMFMDIIIIIMIIIFIMEVREGAEQFVGSSGGNAGGFFYKMNNLSRID